MFILLVHQLYPPKISTITQQNAVFYLSKVVECLWYVPCK